MCPTVQSRFRGREARDVMPLPDRPGSAFRASVPTRSPSKPPDTGSGIASYSLDLLLRSIETQLRSRSDGLTGAVSLECTDTGERVILGFGGGEVRLDADPAAERVVLTERQVVQLVFGGHFSCEPLDLPGKAADLLEQVFPFYFPIWELDRS